MGALLAPGLVALAGVAGTLLFLAAGVCLVVLVVAPAASEEARSPATATARA